MHAEHGAHASQEQIYKAQEDNDSAAIKEDIVSLDSGNTASGILEVMAVLSAVKTICRGNMTFMWRRPRSADLI